MTFSSGDSEYVVMETLYFPALMPADLTPSVSVFLEMMYRPSLFVLTLTRWPFLSVGMNSTLALRSGLPSSVTTPAIDPNSDGGFFLTTGFAGAVLGLATGGWAIGALGVVGLAFSTSPTTIGGAFFSPVEGVFAFVLPAVGFDFGMRLVFGFGVRAFGWALATLGWGWVLGCGLGCTFGLG